MRRRTRSTLLILLASWASLSLSSCGSGEEPSGDSVSSSQGSDSSATSIPSHGGDTSATIVDDEPHSDLEGERRVAWDEVDVVSDSQLRVFFLAGTATCYGTRAVVDENDTTVSIAVFEGTLPDAPSECTLEARYASLLVDLDEPLSGREVVDPDDS